MEKGGRKRVRKIWYSIVWIEWKWREENLIFHCWLDFHPASPFLSLSKLGIKYQKRWWPFFSFPFASQTIFFLRKNQTKITSSFFSHFLPISKHIQGKCFLFLFSCLLFPSLEGQLHSKPGGFKWTPWIEPKNYYYNIFYFLFPVLTLKIKIWTL